MIFYSSHLGARASLDALALLRLLEMVLWLLLLSLLSLLLLRLQCLTLSSLTRFPFHDSQVLKAENGRRFWMSSLSFSYFDPQRE